MSQLPNDLDTFEGIGVTTVINTLEISQNGFRRYMKWHDAIQVCERLGDGWRLPTIEELRTFTRSGANIPNIDPQGKYWSSTIQRHNFDGPVILDMQFDENIVITTQNHALTRPVRDFRKSQINNREIQDEILDAVFFALSSDKENTIYYNNSPADVFFMVSGYKHSIVGNQENTQAQISFKIATNAPKDSINNRFVKHITPITVQNFVEEYILQCRNSELFISFAKTIIDLRKNKLFYKARLDSNFLDSVYAKFELQNTSHSPVIVNNFNNIITRTCRQLAKTWIAKNYN